MTAKEKVKAEIAKLHQHMQEFGYGQSQEKILPGEYDNLFLSYVDLAQLADEMAEALGSASRSLQNRGPADYQELDDVLKKFREFIVNDKL
jgi:hypothetical protein